MPIATSDIKMLGYTGVLNIPPGNGWEFEVYIYDERYVFSNVKCIHILDDSLTQ